MPPRAARPWPTPAKRLAELEHAGEVEADDEEEIGDQEREDRRLELEAPAHLADAGADGDDDRGHGGEGDQHAQRIGDAVAPHGAPLVAGQAREGRGLHGEHREHAGHQVQDQAAQQGEQQRLDQRELLAARARPATRSARRRDRAWPTTSKACLRLAVGRLLGQHQRAGKLGGQGRLGIAALQRDADALGADAGRLLGHAGDRSPVGREEIDVADGVGLQALGFDDQRGIARLGDAVARRPRALHRQLLARLVEDRAGGGRRGRAGRRHRQGELELAVLGDADVLAHQPVGVGRELEAARGVGGRRDAHQQHGLVLEAVVDDAADVEEMRPRPDDGIGLGAVGQLPGDLGRQARIARVLPVGVPLRPDGLAQRRPRTARPA